MTNKLGYSLNFPETDPHVAEFREIYLGETTATEVDNVRVTSDGSSRVTSDGSYRVTAAPA